MAASGYTPILLYASGTTGNSPSAGNLTNSSGGAELALNYYDGKLFYKDASNAVQVLATKTSATNSISFGTTGLTPNTATQGAVTVAGTLNVANGGTGATSLTANNVILGNGTSAVQVVAPGTSGNVLTSNGTTWASTAPTGVTTGKSIAMAMIFGF